MKLNPQQERAARFGLADGHQADQCGALLVLAGAGTGKTTTIAHRVACLLSAGVSPANILLMTFSRRAAREMTERARRVLAQRSDASGSLRFPWAGTFHGVANKLLRLYARNIGLVPEFSILDRSDAADLMDVCRHELGLSSKQKRFPRKGACLDIYSMCTNRQEALKAVLLHDYPWCEEWADDLGRLFRRYVELKQETQSLDYDDLLLYWYYMMQNDELAASIAARFTHVLVDEYQDTNVLQADILKRLKPDGHGVTVVGDDAQSIYSFRAAEVANIRAFPEQYTRRATVIDLETNYRSHQPILDTANVLMGEDADAMPRTLRAARGDGQRPQFVTVEDDAAQAACVIDAVLRHREQGMLLRQQAVLFRNSHHSDLLELELSRHNIPFIKYGGLKFLEAAHIKDLLCLLRWAVNPRDQLAAFRTLQLVAGVGPTTAQKVWEYHALNHFDFAVLEQVEVSAALRSPLQQLAVLMVRCAAHPHRLDDALQAVASWYKPHLEHRYEDAHVRWQDVQQLQMMASQADSAEQFLADLTLDPPSSSGDLAGAPLKDEDYLILSTVHSAKGQEWRAVYVLNVVDGSFPSEFSTGDDQLIEEERRLLYVATTRAKDHLSLLAPLKFYVPQQTRHGDRHVYGAQSRFMTEPVLATCDRRFFGQSAATGHADGANVKLDLPAQLRELW